MKKKNNRPAALLAASVFAAALLAGCSQAPVSQLASLSSSAVYPVATGQTASSAVLPQQTSASSAASVSAGDLLSEEEARRIVLEHAGLTEDQVTFVTFEMDKKRNYTEYELEFRAGSEEYDYEINAATGEILSFDRDLEGGPSAQSAVGEQIGLEAAQNAALAHAGLAQDQVRGMQAELDWDDGRQLYEIEFYAGYTEYEYEIDAFSGEVLSYSAEQH